MENRSHLMSLKLGHALLSSFAKGYDASRLLKDIMAGITVGIIAIPLSMALAIACGVDPQYGLYTVIIAGLIAPLTGGSRFSITGPTAAFIVILHPIVLQYGLGGLLLATLMAGVILLIIAYAKLGRLIQYIPEPVTLGFTCGIALMISILQIKDFFGLDVQQMPDHFLQKVWVLLGSVHEFHGASLAVAVLTLLIMIVWPKLKLPVPPHLPALLVSGFFAFFLIEQGWHVETVGTLFDYHKPDGSLAKGIPPYLPEFTWPWLQPGADGQPLALTWSLFYDLLMAAFGIAILVSIESLLCAVMLDKMSGHKHSANSELLGQGLGNILVSLFGGISATAALARSSANFRAGAQTSLAAIIHSVVVLLSLLLFAKVLAHVPMPAMAALLIMVAWNMSEAPRVVRLMKKAPMNDVIVFVACLALTVALDIVIAIVASVLLACVLFMNQNAAMARISDITHNKKRVDCDLPSKWRVMKVSGPLFFAAADRIFEQLGEKLDDLDGLILYLDGVPILDAGGVVALEHLIEHAQKHGKKIYFADWQFQPMQTLTRAQILPISGVTRYFLTLHDAVHSFQDESAHDVISGDVPEAFTSVNPLLASSK